MLFKFGYPQCEACYNSNYDLSGSGRGHTVTLGVLLLGYCKLICHKKLGTKILGKMSRTKILGGTDIQVTILE